MATPERPRDLGYALKLAQQAVRTAMEAELRPTGLSVAQYSTLLLLSLEPGLTNADLARRAFITAQSMQAVLAKLERDGLITRQADAEHGRRQPAVMTETGRAALARAREAVERNEAQLNDCLDPLTRAQMFAVLERIRVGMSGG